MIWRIKADTPGSINLNCCGKVLWVWEVLESYLPSLPWLAVLYSILSSASLSLPWRLETKSNCISSGISFLKFIILINLVLAFSVKSSTFSSTKLMSSLLLILSTFSGTPILSFSTETFSVLDKSINPSVLPFSSILDIGPLYWGNTLINSPFVSLINLVNSCLVKELRPTSFNFVS